MIDSNNVFSPLVFVGVYFLGLGLNFTPCVYPMLSITVSLFRKSDGHTAAHSFLRAFFYVLGMAAMYSALGFAAAFSGNILGSCLRNFWLQLFYGVLIVAMAASLLGFYTFRLPSWFLPQSIVNSKKTSYAMFFLSGLFVGVIAAPCIGPAVVSLLGMAGSLKNPVLGFAMFFTLALGLGTPYLLLGAFSQLLVKLPKSGSWLVWFERLMGVILLGFGLFYIALAFQIPFLHKVFPVGLVASGIYLGWIVSDGKKDTVRKIFGTSVALIGFVLFFETQSDVDTWKKYNAGVLEKAIAAEKFAVLDFYADWCVECRILEKEVLASARVQNALKCFEKIRVDATGVENSEIDNLLKRFNIRGLPTVVFLSSNGSEIKDARIVGGVSEEEMLKRLENKHFPVCLNEGNDN